MKASAKFRFHVVTASGAHVIGEPSVNTLEGTISAAQDQLGGGATFSYDKVWRGTRHDGIYAQVVSLAGVYGFGEHHAGVILFSRAIGHEVPLVPRTGAAPLIEAGSGPTSIPELGQLARSINAGARKNQRPAPLASQLFDYAMQDQIDNERASGGGFIPAEVQALTIKPRKLRVANPGPATAEEVTEFAREVIQANRAAGIGQAATLPRPGLIELTTEQLLSTEAEVRAEHGPPVDDFDPFQVEQPAKPARVDTSLPKWFVDYRLKFDSGRLYEMGSREVVRASTKEEARKVFSAARKGIRLKVEEISPAPKNSKVTAG